MSIREVTYYVAACDWPGCDATAHDGTDFTAYGSPDQAEYDVENAEWWVDAITTGFWFCPRHPAVWASDLEGEHAEAYPETPFLLIHDGDTGNPDHDGKVTLIGGDL